MVDQLSRWVLLSPLIETVMVDQLSRWVLVTTDWNSHVDQLSRWVLVTTDWNSHGGSAVQVSSCHHWLKQSWWISCPGKFSCHHWLKQSWWISCPGESLSPLIETVMVDQLSRWVLVTTDWNSHGGSAVQVSSCHHCLELASNPYHGKRRYILFFNSVDPDQAGFWEASWSGSILFNLLLVNVC